MRKLLIGAGLVLFAAACGGGASANSSSPPSVSLEVQSSPPPTSKPAKHKVRAVRKTVRDAKGDVAVRGIAIVRVEATRHPNGDLDVAMDLAGHYVRDGIYAVYIESPGGGFYQLSADVLPGETDYQLFDMNAGLMVEKHAPGAMSSDLVLISALGSDLGWHGHGTTRSTLRRSPAKARARRLTRCPTTGSQGREGSSSSSTAGGRRTA